MFVRACPDSLSASERCSLNIVSDFDRFYCNDINTIVMIVCYRIETESQLLPFDITSNSLANRFNRRKFRGYNKL